MDLRYTVRHYFVVLIVVILAVVLFGLFYVVPMVYLLRTSFWHYSPTLIGSKGFMEPAFTLENYSLALTGAYLNDIIVTLRIGLVCTIAAVLMSYPVAYWIGRWNGHARLKRFVLVTLIASFLVGTIARVFAWYSMLSGNGFINALVALFGFTKISFIGTESAIDICQTQYLMSIATLSLVSPLKNADPRLEEASKSLGAGEIRTFIRVTLPLTLPGIVAASLLCFAVTVSAFVTPMVLGAGGILMVSNLVSNYFLTISNYPLASAFAVILLLTSFSAMYALEKLLLSLIRS